jgi:hypothetical protein
VGRTPPFLDGQIAAIAFVNDLVLVTRNVDDFAPFEKLRIENRFEGRPYDPPRASSNPEDVADSVVQALHLPRTAELTDLHIRPMRGVSLPG